MEALLSAGANVRIGNANGINPIDECSEPWSDKISEKVNFLNQAIKVNVEEKEVQAGRPIVLELLQEHASQSGSGFQITTSAKK